MRSDDEVRRVFRLAARGLPHAEIARQVGVARATVRDWVTHGEHVVLNRPMRAASIRRHDDTTCPATGEIDEPAYAYTLGQYLGDGCISRIGHGHRLRVACCDSYPDIMREVGTMIQRLIPGQRVGHVQHQGCTEVYATSPHWPCLLPHGPAPKHLRPIVLADWQRAIALDRCPEQLLRGLIQSDGCRITNRVRRGGRTYEYPRYLFTNKSSDIQSLYLEACARLGVEARPNNRWSISVARRASVARLDEFVGPKS